jgi:hypothetical protein
MANTLRSQCHVAPEYQPILRVIGLDADAVFTHPDIKVWRSIPERENAILDGSRPDGSAIRLHIKRYRPTRHAVTPAVNEAKAIQLLRSASIPTVPLVGWGNLGDGHSFVITEDLLGYQPADRLIEQGTSFEKLLISTANLAARLHSADLHHRDLYLCHFLVRMNDDAIDIRLIDPARVRQLPVWPFRNRWIVKDLAQFHYSAQQVSVSESLLSQWLDYYARQSGRKISRWLSRSITRKSEWIARHDKKLRQNQPARNISIPPSP